MGFRPTGCRWDPTSMRRMKSFEFGIDRFERVLSSIECHNFRDIEFQYLRFIFYHIDSIDIDFVSFRGDNPEFCNL